MMYYRDSGPRFMWVFPILIALALVAGLLQPSCDNDTPDPTEPYWTAPTMAVVLDELVDRSWGMPSRDPQLGIVQQYFDSTLVCLNEIWEFRRGNERLYVYFLDSLVVHMDTTIVDLTGPRVVVGDPPKQKEAE